MIQNQDTSLEKNQNALRKILENLTIPLSEDKSKRDIVFIEDVLGAVPNKDKDCIKLNPKPSEYFNVNISEEMEFALLMDTESHELEHLTVSNLNSKKEFSEQYSYRKKLAAYVINVVEDIYIDKRRTNRDRGLKPVNEFKSNLLFENSSPIYELEPIQKYSAAVLMIGKCGTVKGIEKTDKEFQNYCAKLRIILDEARNEHTQKGRWNKAEEIMSLIEEYIGTQDVKELEMPDGCKSQIDQDVIQMEPSEKSPDETENSNNSNNNRNSITIQNNTVKCPECNSTNVTESEEMVDWKMAARSNSPFSPNEKWVDSVEFVYNEDVCGFRVKTKDKIPTNRIESNRYKIAKIKNGVEILEKRDNYDNEELIIYFNCEDCNYEWIPNLI